MSAAACQHLDFDAHVNVTRITKVEGGPVERYQADVRIHCTACKTPFRFLGLPAGLDLLGAAVSVDGEEARLSLAPRGEVLAPLDPGAVSGFTMRRLPS